jgi:hypothetical protein
VQIAFKEERMPRVFDHSFGRFAKMFDAQYIGRIEQREKREKFCVVVGNLIMGVVVKVA